MRDEIEQVIAAADRRLSTPARCGCGGEYAGHGSCEDRALIERLVTLLQRSRAVPSPGGAAEQDAYPWGETMPRYAVLGVGAKAWVELTESERNLRAQSIRAREVSVSADTFLAVMNVLHDIKPKDFKGAAEGRSHAVPPPLERNMDKHKVGLYHKFNVTRTDGQSAAGQKHDGCDYFVLDLTHDPHARPALAAYAESCAADYPALASDLQKRSGEAAESRTVLPEPPWQSIETYPDDTEYRLLYSPAHGHVIGAHVTGDVWHLVGVGCITSASERPKLWAQLPDVPALSPDTDTAPSQSEEQ